MSNSDLAKGVFDNIPHVTKVWVKDGEFHINKPTSEGWELIEKETLETKTKKTKINHKALTS